MILGAALLAAACGPRPSAQVEKVELCSVVGDYGLEADAIEITVSNPRSLKGLKAEDFDLVNNVREQCPGRLHRRGHGPGAD